MDTTIILQKAQIVDLTSKVDSLNNALNLLSNANQHYIDILEKTNNQLNIFLNPYVFLICALGVLFAIAAIISGFILFRQSNEYKKTLDDFWKKNQDRFDAFMHSKDDQLKAQGIKLDKAYNDRISKIDVEIDKMKRIAEKPQKPQDPQEIDEVKKANELIKELSSKKDDLIIERENIKYSGIASTMPFSLTGLNEKYYSGYTAGRQINSIDNYTICCNCHQPFPIIAGVQVNSCPHCHAVNGLS